MDYSNIKSEIDYIFKDVFGQTIELNEEIIKNKLCFDIPLPVPKKCEFSGVDTWVYPEEDKRYVSKKASMEKSKKDEWSKSAIKINSVEDVLKAWEEVNYLTGDKYTDSVNVDKSDEIMNSSDVYYSALIGNSKNVYYSYNNFNCNNLIASRGNNSCTFAIRNKENAYCSSCYEVNYSGKVSRSMYINDCFDLYECLFCNNMSSKKYCIANMQYEKNEYFRIKKMVVEWVLNSLK